MGSAIPADRYRERQKTGREATKKQHEKKTISLIGTMNVATELLTLKEQGFKCNHTSREGQAPVPGQGAGSWLHSSGGLMGKFSDTPL